MSQPEESRNVGSPSPQKRWRDCKLALAVFALAVIVGVLAGFLRVRTSSPKVLLEVDPSRLDLGKVFVSEAFRFSLPVKNVSNRDVEIPEIRSSCRCTSFDPIPLTIPAGDSASINAVIDLSAGSPEEAALPWRPFSVRLVAVIRDQLPKSCPQWEVRGTVRTPLVFSPWAPEFAEGDLARGGEFRSLDVGIISHSPLRQLSATCDEGLAAVRVVPTAGKEGNYQLAVAPRAGLQLGEYVFQIRFRGITADGEQFDGVPLRVRGTVVDDVEMLPPMILAGAVTVGQTVTDTVVLRSRSGKRFAVTEVRPASGEVRCESPADADTAAQCKFRITLHASEVGSQQFEVTFTVRTSADSEGRALPLRLAYFGLMQRSASETQTAP